MIRLEFYPVGDDRMGDMLAFFVADHVPQRGSVVMLRRVKGEGFERHRVREVEYWFDAIDDETVKSAVIEVEREETST